MSHIYVSHVTCMNTIDFRHFDGIQGSFDGILSSFDGIQGSFDGI